MNRINKVLALLLAVAMLLTFAACGKDKGGDTTTATTTTTSPSDGDGLLPDDQRDGSKELPFEIGGVLEFDAVVKAGGVTYYDVLRVGGTILTLESASATIEYDGKVYEPVDGVISFFVTTDDVRNPIKLAIGNTGTTDATFKVTFTYPKGTLLNPYELTVGDLTTSFEAGNETGVVYTYTAAEAGTLSVMFKDFVADGASRWDSSRFDIALYNLTSGANCTFIEDGADDAVSVTVAQGDEVRITYMVLPNDKNEYPAVTLKTLVGFAKGDATDAPTEKMVDYTVTVKDQNGNPVSGVKISISCEMIAATITTDSKGVAKANLPEGIPSGTIEVPNGYIAASKHLNFKAGETSLTIVLEKEQADPPAPPADPEVTTMDYTVTLLDGSGNPMGGLTVLFYSGDKQVAKQVGDKKGVSKVTLDRGTYTVKVEGSTLKYDEKAAVVSVNKPSVSLTLAADIDTSKTYKLTVTYPDETDRRFTVYYLSEGAAYVTLTPGERNYFMFEPKTAGTYRFAASNTYAKIGYFGADMFVYMDNVAEVSGNAFNMSVSETQIGNIFVIGIDAATNCSAAVVQITRIGDPAWSLEDVPTTEYKGNGAPKQVTAPSGLTDLDIKSSTEHHLVYNEKDGYYHLDSANGPVVYVHMDHPSASFVGLLKEFGNMTAVLYNADGSLKIKEQYAVLMQQYVDKMDKTQKVYPLTQDLKYMIENYGSSQNWWNAGEPGYLFEEAEGVHPASAWMFLYCYKK